MRGLLVGVLTFAAACSSNPVPAGQPVPQPVLEPVPAAAPAAVMPEPCIGGICPLPPATYLEAQPAPRLQLEPEVPACEPQAAPAVAPALHQDQAIEPAQPQEKWCGLGWVVLMVAAAAAIIAALRTTKRWASMPALFVAPTSGRATVSLMFLLAAAIILFIWSRKP